MAQREDLKGPFHVAPKPLNQIAAIIDSNGRKIVIVGLVLLVTFY